MIATRIVRQDQVEPSTLVSGMVAGVTAGLFGGSVFGVQMAVGGMLPMVARMLGSQNLVIGFLLHLTISAVIGGMYAIAAARLPTNWLVVVGAGVAIASSGGFSVR